MPKHSSHSELGRDRMKNIIKIEIGDWSGDGHGISEVHIIYTNLTHEEMLEAYKIAVDKLGFDFCKEVCSNYEEITISDPKKIKALKKHVIDLEAGNFQKDEKGYWLDDDRFFDIYFRMIKLGNPSFVYEDKTMELPWISIGGYGVFSH